MCVNAQVYITLERKQVLSRSYVWEIFEDFGGGADKLTAQQNRGSVASYSDAPCQVMPLNKTRDIFW